MLHRLNLKNGPGVGVNSSSIILKVKMLHHQYRELCGYKQYVLKVTNASIGIDKLITYSKFINRWKIKISSRKNVAVTPSKLIYFGFDET